MITTELHGESVWTMGLNRPDKRNAFTPAGTRLVAKGINDNEGGAEIVTYETSSGGEVYSVGSISYGASLLVDDLLSRITANVVRRFLR